MGCKNRLTPANGKDVLKAKRMTPKRLYAKSEEMANLGKGEALVRFRDDSNLPRGHIAWNQYLENNFDQIYQEFHESVGAGAKPNECCFPFSN